MIFFYKCPVNIKYNTDFVTCHLGAAAVPEVERSTSDTNIPGSLPAHVLKRPWTTKPHIIPGGCGRHHVWQWSRRLCVNMWGNETGNGKCIWALITIERSIEKCHKKMLFYHVPNVGDVCFPDTSTPPKQQQSWQTSMLESMG